MKKFLAILYRASSLLSFIAGGLIIFIAGLTVADVLLRYAYGNSILGTSDISSLLLVAVAFLGLSSAEFDGRHVSVDLLENHLPHGFRRFLGFLRTLLFIFLAVIIVWGLVNVLSSSIDRNETTNGILRLATWPTKLVLLVSFSLYFFVLILKSVNDCCDVFSKKELENDGAECKDNIIDNDLIKSGDYKGDGA